MAAGVPLPRPLAVCSYTPRGCGTGPLHPPSGPHTAHSLQLAWSAYAPVRVVGVRCSLTVSRGFCGSLCFPLFVPLQGPAGGRRAFFQSVEYASSGPSRSRCWRRYACTGFPGSFLWHPMTGLGVYHPSRFSEDFSLGFQVRA